MMPPPPDIHKLNEEAALLEEPEDETVATGREAFALLYQELASLTAEVRAQYIQLPADQRTCPPARARPYIHRAVFQRLALPDAGTAGARCGAGCM